MEGKRKAEREIPLKDLKGDFTLHAGESVYDVTIEGIEIRDVSPFGIGIKIKDKVDKDSKITLCYKHNDIELAVCGAVVWVSDESDEKDFYKAGISLSPEDVSTNMKFYKLLMGYEQN